MAALPARLRLAAQPNPFNRPTRIVLSMAGEARAELNIHIVASKLVLLR